ncbi:divalent-cation tolerance protein CutA [Chelativorans sp. Marseille-P2723]|uniref:divalent-cation tolerance protein CutA n=1 Tax=Chelativorans sp. Marseille-P2723 TaxID=2709133 RepID=UPI00156F5AE8|nr:divalent-cation tolerance protein CutA [Chelativorans sp. Marseille-P2723]
MARFIEIAVTCPDRNTADRIAAEMISERLAACANISGPITSRYHWQGAVETAEEVTLLLKTRTEHFQAVCDAVRALHPYEVPAIVAAEISHVDRAYADWLRKETREPA